jgi:hypothetical protein
MNFNRMLLGMIAASLACAPVARIQAGPPPPPFVSAAFPEPPEPQTVNIQDETAKNAAVILGQRYPQPSVSYWRANGKTAWILEAQGKSKMISTGFVISKGRIEKSQVLVYREQRGREVRTSAFLKQFTGATLTRDQKFDCSIDGITGATISTDIIINMARLALYLDSLAPIPAKLP